MVPTLCNARSSFCPFGEEIQRFMIYVERDRIRLGGISPLLTFDFTVFRKKKKERFVSRNSRLKKKGITPDRGRTATAFWKNKQRRAETRGRGKKNGFPTKNLGVSRQADANGREGERRWDASWQSWPAKRSWKRG